MSKIWAMELSMMAEKTSAPSGKIKIFSMDKRNSLHRTIFTAQTIRRLTKESDWEKKPEPLTQLAINMR